MHRCFATAALGLILTGTGIAQTTITWATGHKEEEHALPKSDPAFTVNVGIASQYVFRGLTQTNGKPAVQGGFDYAHASGFYLGTWLSNSSWFTDQNAGTASAPVPLSSPGRAGVPYVPNRSNRANLEWDFYGGYKNTFATDWNYDVGLFEFYYPGVYDNLGAYRQPNTTEVYGQLGYRWLSFKYSKAISTHFFGVNESKGTSYADLSAVFPIQDTGFKLQAHLGRQSFPANPNTGYWGASGGDNSFFTYSDVKLGLTFERWGYTFGSAWTYADSKRAAPDGETTAYLNAFGKNIGRGRVTLMVTRSF